MVFAFFDYFGRDAGFSTFKLPAVGAFHDLIMKDMHKKFPDLRWGFVEISASWLPYALNDLSLRFAKRGVAWPGKDCLLYTSPSPRDRTRSRMPSSA